MRVTFVIERYWPLISAASIVLDTVARFLRQQGHEVSVLTAQVDHLWPEEITVRDIPVRRFGLDSWSMFGRKSLGQRVAQWLERNPDQWDLLVVCEVLDGGQYLFQVADQLGRPSMLSFFESGKLSPLGQLLDTPAKEKREGTAVRSGSVPRRSNWLTRKYWTVPDTESVWGVRQRNAEATVAAWGLGIPNSNVRTIEERRRLRTAICQSRAGFERYCVQPLIVYHGHCLPGPDSQWMWQMLAGLCERRPGVCAWVTGDGAAIHGLWRQTNESGLEDRIIFPGIFSDLSDLYSAADMIVRPQLERRQDFEWLAGVAVGTPSLVAQSPGTDRVMQLVNGGSNDQTLWNQVLPRHLEQWWEHAFQILDHPESARLQVLQQRTELLLRYNERDTLQRYEQLLLQLKEEIGCPPRSR